MRLSTAPTSAVMVTYWRASASKQNRATGIRSSLAFTTTGNSSPCHCGPWARSLSSTRCPRIAFDAVVRCRTRSCSTTQLRNQTRMDARADNPRCNCQPRDDQWLRGKESAEPPGWIDRGGVTQAWRPIHTFTHEFHFGFACQDFTKRKCKK